MDGVTVDCGGPMVPGLERARLLIPLPIIKSRLTLLSEQLMGFKLGSW